MIPLSGAYRSNKTPKIHFCQFLAFYRLPGPKANGRRMIPRIEIGGAIERLSPIAKAPGLVRKLG